MLFSYGAVEAGS